MCSITNIMLQNIIPTPILSKGQLISHNFPPFHKFERPQKPRRDFRTLSKLNQTLVWFHPQENSVSNFIVVINVMHINITILPILCYFNPLSYHFHLVFHSWIISSPTSTLTSIRSQLNGLRNGQS